MPRPLLVLPLVAIMAGTAVGESPPAPSEAPKAPPSPPATLEGTAPDFTFTDFDGKRWSASGLRGKTVVLEWLDIACPCTDRHYRAGTIQRVQRKAAQDGVVWISLFADHRKETARPDFTAGIRQAMRLWNAAPAALAADPDAAIARKFKVTFSPTAVIIGPTGTILYHGVLDSSTLQGETSPEQVLKAVNFIGQALDDARAGRAVRLPRTVTLGCALKGLAAGP